MKTACFTGPRPNKLWGYNKDPYVPFVNKLNEVKNMENNTSDIYKNRKWVNARQPADVDRTDWHRNSQGLVDYLPVDANCHRTGNETPLEKQKYDVEHEMKRERGASSLAAIRESKPDWDEYERIINEFN